MVINENILLAYGNHNNGGTVQNSTTSAITPVKKGQKYTISYTVKNSNRFGIYFDTLSNGINEKYDVLDGYQRFDSTVIGQKINRTVVADIDGYMVIYLANTGGDVKEVDLKIEEGDKKTPYIPSKNMLEPSKQPLLPPEGNYKEIQALQESLGSIF